MSERPAETAISDEDQAALDRVADELYALKPDDFAPTRDAAVREARQAGSQALARELAKLRKPTQSAWLVNLLWRDQHEVMEQLFELAHDLSQAQADAAGSALRELTAQRRQLENALMRRAVELGQQAGVRVSDTTTREAQETLSAALALPEVADEVRSGRLVKPASYAGFGGAAPPPPAAPRRAPAPIDLGAIRQRRAGAGEHDAGSRSGTGAPSARGADAGQAEREAADEQAQREAAEEEAARRAAEEAERRAAAERRLAQARREADRASLTVADRTRAAEDAHARARDLRQQVETLRAQLTRVEREADRAEQSAADADTQRQSAESAQSEAAEAVKAAEQELAH